MDISPHVRPLSESHRATPDGDRAPMQPTIQLHIERVVFDGIDIPQAQRPQFQAALTAELTRLLSDRGLADAWQTGGAIPHLNAGSLHLSTTADPVRLGQQLAQTIYGGLTP